MPKILNHLAENTKSDQLQKSEDETIGLSSRRRRELQTGIFNRRFTKY